MKRGARLPRNGTRGGGLDDRAKGSMDGMKKREVGWVLVMQAPGRYCMQAGEGQGVVLPHAGQANRHWTASTFALSPATPSHAAGCSICTIGVGRWWVRWYVWINARCANTRAVGAANLVGLASRRYRAVLAALGCQRESSRGCRHKGSRPGRQEAKRRRDGRAGRETGSVQFATQCRREKRVRGGIRVGSGCRNDGIKGPWGRCCLWSVAACVWRSWSGRWGC